MLVKKGIARQAEGAGETFETPLVTIDIIILTLRDEQLHVLLMRRGAEPFANWWALPGGYIHPQEDPDLDQAARRILETKTGIRTPYMEQLQAFGDAQRDPRGWTATFAYFALISSGALVLRQGANAEEVAWSQIKGKQVETPLAFDHARILAAAVSRLRSKVEYTSLPAHLLPPKFNLPDLPKRYAQILGREMDKSAFRKRMAE